MIKENRYLVFDTETMGLKSRVVYDIGYYIVNKKGHVFASRRFLVKGIITDPAIMRDAHFHKKIYTDYLEILDNAPDRLIYTWAEVQEFIREDIKTYNVNIFSAYNLPFDISAVNATNKHCGTAKLLTNKPMLLDLWLYSCLYLFNTNFYKEMATDNNWISEAGNYFTRAEHAYRFISNNADYIEPHTALEDAEIETEILLRLIRKKRKIPYNVLNSHPWRIPNNK